MEFDKSKILTAITARQAKEGQKGWFGECEDEIVRNLECEPSSIKEINRSRAYAFRSESDFCLYPFFYPAPEPTYAERQEEWIKKHNLKEGDKVKILRTAKDGEDGWCDSWTESMSRLVGSVFTYNMAYKRGISLSCGYNWPYFVLEVVKEPTYRPFKNDEEYKPYRNKWLKTGCIIFQINGYDNDGIIIDDDYSSWEKAFRSYKFDDGMPFGIKEEV